MSLETYEEYQLQDCLPDSIRDDSNVAACAKAIAPFLKSIAGMYDLPCIYYRLDSLTSDQLDHLAAQFDVTAWRETWEIELKRSVIKSAIESKRRVGTLSAVKSAISSFGGAATVTEWWETTPTGTPHTFSVNIAMGTLSSDTDLQTAVLEMVTDAKPVRSHFTYTINNSLSGGIGLGAYARTASIARIKNF